MSRSTTKSDLNGKHLQVVSAREQDINQYPDMIALRELVADLPDDRRDALDGYLVNLDAQKQGDHND
jgi:hypothetical protein